MLQDEQIRKHNHCEKKVSLACTHTMKTYFKRGFVKKEKLEKENVNIIMYRMYYKLVLRGSHNMLIEIYNWIVKWEAKHQRV